VGANFGSTTYVNGAGVCEPQGGPLPCEIACWEYDSQCYGDTDDDEDVDGTDWFVFRDAFGSDYATGWNGGAGPYNPCADLDHDGDVDGTDWFPFRDNFGTSDADDDCPMTCVWPPQ
jgi:hypothetical protein